MMARMRAMMAAAEEEDAVEASSNQGNNAEAAAKAAWLAKQEEGKAPTRAQARGMGR